MGKKRFLERFLKKSTEEVLETAGKGIESVGDLLFNDATDEFSKVSKDFDHLTDRFLKGLMREEWTTKGIYAKDIMEKSSKVKEESSVRSVVNKLKGKEDVLIVIKGQNKIVGMIDELNLLKLLVPEDKITTQEVIGFMGAGYDKAFIAKKAKDLMKKEVYFVTPSVPLEKIAFIMYKTNLRAIPVVKGSRIVGVVHVRDVIGRIK
tara:strand:+ start:203 stop:820 length:618 start_codon:yes stop_codon:yes gene_type:complete